MGNAVRMRLLGWGLIQSDRCPYKKRLGHEKIQTTLSTYAHLYPNQARELAEQMDDLLNDDVDAKKEKEA